MQGSGGGSDLSEILSGGRRAARAWPGIRVEYAWLPPFEGESVTQPNRIEVVFSAHGRVVLGQDGRRYEIAAEAGAGYVVGACPTVLHRVGEYSDTLEIYLDPALLQGDADRAGVTGFGLQPTLGPRTTAFRRDPALLGVAHRLRRAVMGRTEVSDIEASSLAHILAGQVLVRQYRLPDARPSRLDTRALGRVAEVIEAGLAGPVTLADLAAVAGLSPFHFARSFKATTGLAPHQFVLARRIEFAKRLTMSTLLPVQEIAWAAGFENLSHFRRQFVAQVGALPGELRRATGAAARSRPRDVARRAAPGR